MKTTNRKSRLKKFRFLNTSISNAYKDEIEYNIETQSVDPEYIKIFDEFFKNALEADMDLSYLVTQLSKIPNSMLPVKIQETIDRLAKSSKGKGIIIYEYLNDVEKYITDFLSENDVLFLTIQRDFSPYFTESELHRYINYENMIDIMTAETYSNLLFLDKSAKKRRCGFVWPINEDELTPLIQYVDFIKQSNISPKAYEQLRVSLPDAILKTPVPTGGNVYRNIKGYKPSSVFENLGHYYNMWDEYLKGRC